MLSRAAGPKGRRTSRHVRDDVGKSLAGLEDLKRACCHPGLKSKYVGLGRSDMMRGSGKYGLKTSTPGWALPRPGKGPAFRCPTVQVPCRNVQENHRTRGGLHQVSVSVWTFSGTCDLAKNRSLGMSGSRGVGHRGHILPSSQPWRRERADRSDVLRVSEPADVEGRESQACAPGAVRPYEALIFRRHLYVDPVQNVVGIVSALR